MDRPLDAPDRGLRDHVGVLRRRWAIVVGITGLAALSSLVFSLRQPTTYSASADVLFKQEQSSVDDPNNDQMVLSKRLDPARVMQNEMQLAGSQVVRERAARAIGAPVQGSAQNVRDSDVIAITATAASPERAAEAANAWADAYAQVSRDQYDQESTASLDAIDQQLATITARVSAIDSSLADPTTPSARQNELSGERAALVDQQQRWTQQRALVQADQALAAQNGVTVINRANPPASPSQPATLRNLVLASVLGFLLALAVAYAVDQLDDVIRTPDDLERAAHLPVVAVVAQSVARDKVRAVPIDDPTLRRDDTEPPFLVDDVPAGDEARILLVPVRSHGRKVRQSMTLFEGLGVTIVGCALVHPAAGTPSVAPARHDEVRDPVPG